MRRVVSVFLPTWPTDRFRRRNGEPPRDKPLVAVMREGSRRVLVAADAAAQKLGLRPGMTVAHAQALVPGLTVIEACPHEDAEALARLALWSLRYAPIVAPDPPDGILVDIAGADHLCGGEAALLQDFLRRLRRNGVKAKAAVADTPAAAWAAARFGAMTIVPPGRMADAIAGLPVAALRLSAETVEGLRSAGFERIGAIMMKPKGPFIRRFGPEVMRRLAQALGHEPDLIEPLFPRETPQCKRTLVEPIGEPEVLTRVAADLCADLCSALETRGEGARRLDLVFRRIDNAFQAIRVGTARPSREPRHLLRLFAERLPGIDPGFGIEEALLIASEVEPLQGRQMVGRHVLEQDADAELGELVDRVAVRLAASGPYRIASVESRIPERSVRKAPPLATAASAAWPAGLPRPHLLVEPPEVIVALNTDQPPKLFTWRGRRRNVAKADGPERIHGEWWISDDEILLVRDYYRVETDEGERFWLFRDAPAAQGGRWFMQGVFA
jgi:protein ImuB